MLTFTNNNASRVLVYLRRNREIENMQIRKFRTSLFLWYKWICGEGYVWSIFPTKNPLTFDFFASNLNSYVPIVPEIQSMELSERCQYLARMTSCPEEIWEIVFFVSERAGITEKLQDTNYLPPYSSIQQANWEIWRPSEISQYWFMEYGKKGEPMLTLEYKQLPDLRSCTILPMRFFFDSSRSYYFYGPDFPVDYSFGIPNTQNRICNLFNIDKMYGRPDATVELNPDLSDAISIQSDAQRIFSSWYGEWETWEKIDLSVLSGHPIVLSCYDRPDEAKNTGFRNVISMLNRLRNHDCSVKVEVHDEIRWESNLSWDRERGFATKTQLLSIPEFIREASRRGVDCSALEECHELRVIPAKELIKIPPEEYILYPILKPGTYNLIYGASGVAKTWFTLHIALSLSLGCSPFPQWEFHGVAQKVLYFAGEMSDSEYGQRINALLNGQKPNDNFDLIRENLDIAAEEDQKRIMKTITDKGVQIVVFDNLVTLSSNGHTDGQFGMIQKLFDKLKKERISVILVHHENREGGFKGTAKIEQVADQSLHLLQAGNGRKIELLVKPEKIRNTARSEQPSFRTEFDPKSPVVPWEIFKPTKEELRRLDEDDPLDEIGRNAGKKRNNHQLVWNYMSEDAKAIAIIDDMLSGCMDDIIAANLVVREQAIIAFKEDHGICEDSLKKHMPEATKKTENQSSKVATPELAWFLWQMIRDERKTS